MDVNWKTDRYESQLKECISEHGSYESNSEDSVVRNTESKLEMILELEQFEPDEVKLKLSGFCLIVEAEKVCRDDSNHTLDRKFTRSYFLPMNCILEAINAEFEKGKLKIVIPKRPPSPVREISIKVIGLDKANESSNMLGDGPSSELNTANISSVKQQDKSSSTNTQIVHEKSNQTCGVQNEKPKSELYVFEKASETDTQIVHEKSNQTCNELEKK